ncbi:hypothetical protein J6590_001013 [Homalodisca vitripennis]|nr:hypothetical protein J6590_001013 [Homalodisca vitripennis]
MRILWPTVMYKARREFVIFLYVMFLGIVPFIAVASLFVYYMKRNPTFWRKKPRISKYVSCWLRHTPNTSYPPRDQVFANNPPNTSDTKNIYSVVEGETPEHTVGTDCATIGYLDVRTLRNTFENKTYCEDSNKSLYSNVKIPGLLPSCGESTRCPNLSEMVSTNSNQWNTEMLTSNRRRFNSDDTDDTWDSETCSNSIYDTVECNPPTRKKFVVKKSKKIMINAKHLVNKGFKNVSDLLNNSENKGESASYGTEVKIKRPKIDIVKSNLVYTTNEQVQHMMSSTNSLKK